MKILNVLEKVAKKFNEKNVEWSIGGSLLLYFYSIVDSPSDIDIVINPKYSEVVIEIMNDLGRELKDIKDVPNYKTEVFSKYYVDNIEIDIIGNFKILSKDEVYVHKFDFNNSIIKKLNKTNIYLDSLENWAITYGKMGDPKNRVNLIKSYLKKG